MFFYSLKSLKVWIPRIYNYESFVTLLYIFRSVKIHWQHIPCLISTFVLSSTFAMYSNVVFTDNLPDLSSSSSSSSIYFACYLQTYGTNRKLEYGSWTPHHMHFINFSCNNFMQICCFFFIHFTSHSAVQSYH